MLEGELSLSTSLSSRQQKVTGGFATSYSRNSMNANGLYAALVVQTERKPRFKELSDGFRGRMSVWKNEASNWRKRRGRVGYQWSGLPM